MREMIDSIATKVGIAPALAEKAIGMILAFLQKHGPEGATTAMMASLPGAAELAARHAPSEEGGGLMGGGSVMALGQQLMAQGIGMGQIGVLSKEVFAHAKDHVGEEKMGEIVAAIPGLSQFV